MIRYVRPFVQDRFKCVACFFFPSFRARIVDAVIPIPMQEARISCFRKFATRKKIAPRDNAARYGSPGRNCIKINASSSRYFRERKASTRENRMSEEAYNFRIELLSLRFSDLNFSIFNFSFFLTALSITFVITKL